MTKYECSAAIIEIGNKPDGSSKCPSFPCKAMVNRYVSMFRRFSSRELFQGSFVVSSYYRLCVKSVVKRSNAWSVIQWLRYPVLLGNNLIGALITSGAMKPPCLT